MGKLYNRNLVLLTRYRSYGQAPASALKAEALKFQLSIDILDSRRLSLTTLAATRPISASRVPWAKRAGLPALGVDLIDALAALCY